jgi:hypothetical protein
MASMKDDTPLRLLRMQNVISTLRAERALLAHRLKMAQLANARLRRIVALQRQANRETADVRAAARPETAEGHHRA